jgi:hypothetical protein
MEEDGQFFMSEEARLRAAEEDPDPATYVSMVSQNPALMAMLQKSIIPNKRDIPDGYPDLNEGMDELSMAMEKMKHSRQNGENKNSMIKSSLNLNNKLYKLHKLDGFIYIATSDIHKISNCYILGSCSDLDDEMVMFREQSPDNVIYYVFTYEIEDCAYVLYNLRYMLRAYTANGENNEYILPWEIISKFVTDICDTFHNELTPKRNRLIKAKIDHDEVHYPKRLH